MIQKLHNISLVMIAKNEGKGLERAIISCKDFVDKIYISVDTKSTDQTLEIAKQYADVIIEHEWKNDFSAARNNIQKQVKTKWCLMLDGHEYVKEYSNLEKALESEKDGLFVKIEMEGGFSFYFPRIFKTNIKWEMEVHNYPKCKTNKIYKDFAIVHDRLHLQSKEAIKERTKQREEMVFGILHRNIKKEKKDVRSLFYLSQQYRLGKKPKPAIKYYKQYLKYSKIKSERWLSCYYLAECANNIDKPKKAIKFLKWAEKETPNKWEIAKRLGATYMLRGKWNKALPWLINSFKKPKAPSVFEPEQRNDAQTWYLISQCFFALKKYEEAKIAMKQSLRDQGSSPYQQLPKQQIRIAEELIGNQITPTEQKQNTTKDKAMIEICFLIYKRYKRLPEILEQLKNQTIQNFTVNIWNNSGQKLDISDFPQDRIKIINSQENVGSQARFKLARKTIGNPIIFFDDDEYLYPDFIEYHYNQYLKFGPKCILGYFTRTFDKEEYWKSKGAMHGQDVDYIATKAMILDRRIIDIESLLQDIPQDFIKVEDLYLCYLARQTYGIRMVKINPASRSIVDNQDQWTNIDKEKAFSLLRENGWKLLKDGVKNFGGFNFQIRKGQWDEAILTGEVDPKYYKIPANPKVVVDIGAHIGGTSILAASLGAKVYAYEPENENFKLLKENIKLNNLENKIHCIQKAIGKAGKRNIYLTAGNSGMTTLLPEGKIDKQVEVISIDKVFENIPHCDLVKIDCEGAEYEFITNMPFAKIDQISMELHKGKQTEVIQYLKQFYEVITEPAIDGTSLMVFCKKTNINQVKNTAK